MSLIKNLLRPVARKLWHGVKHILEFCGWDYSRIFQIRRGIHLIVFQTDLLPAPHTALNTQEEHNGCLLSSDYNTFCQVYKEL